MPIQRLANLFPDQLVGWLVGKVGWLVSWLVGWLVGSLVRWFVGWFWISVLGQTRVEHEWLLSSVGAGKLRQSRDTCF